VLQTILAQVTDRRDLAVGVEMPLELGTEVSTHHSDPHQFVAGGPGKDSSGWGNTRERRRGGSNSDPLQKLTAPDGIRRVVMGHVSFSSSIVKSHHSRVMVNLI
jgi:hypothetical protein